MRIKILDDAKDDILSSTLFYESQQYGAGDYLLDSISSDIESLHFICRYSSYEIWLLHALL